MEIVVGRIGRAHGVRGEVRVDSRTDSPERRFAIGAVLRSDAAGWGKLTVRAVRPHSGALLVRFDEVADRTSAETLRGASLYAEVTEDERPDDAEEYYDWQLVGLAVRTVAGDSVGEITDVAHLPQQDVLVVRRPDGAEALIPFVRAIVPTVDLDGGYVVVDDEPGLLEET